MPEPAHATDSSPASVHGRQLPRSIEAEEFLLSCCFLDGADVIARCLEAGFGADTFFEWRNGVVFDCMAALYHRNQPTDVAVVAEELRSSKKLDSIGGVAYLTQISGRIPTTAQAGYFIQQVRDYSLLRSVIRVSTTILENCYSFTGGIDEFIDRTESEVFRVTQSRVSGHAKQMRESSAAAMNVISRMLAKKGELTGVSSGFTDLDKLLWGFQRQEMIVLAARPSMGKTSLALNFAEAAALPQRGPGVPVLIFSLEMGAAQLALRMLCSRASVNLKLLRDGLIAKSGPETQRLAAVSEEFSKAPIFIDDSSSLSVLQLRAKARRIHSRQPLGLVVVDYLQLLSSADPRLPREQQVAEASRGLKAMAKELDVPVIVLSQLNRSSEKESRAPRLSDLRESGSIEQDADVVLMLARPNDADGRFQVAAESADLIVAKQRNGPVGEIKLSFMRDITRFRNFAASG